MGIWWSLFLPSYSCNSSRLVAMCRFHSFSLGSFQDLRRFLWPRSWFIGRRYLIVLPRSLFYRWFRGPVLCDTRVSVLVILFLLCVVCVFRKRKNYSSFCFNCLSAARISVHQQVIMLHSKGINYSSSIWWLFPSLELEGSCFQLWSANLLCWTRGFYLAVSLFPPWYCSFTFLGYRMFPHLFSFDSLALPFVA